MEDFTDDQIQRILLEHRFCMTAKALCAKWGITPYRLRKWKKERLPRGLIWSIEECIVAAIHPGGWHEPSELIEWLDYQNHARYSPLEVLQFLETLERRGEVERSADTFRYVQVDPPYVFGPR